MPRQSKSRLANERADQIRRIARLCSMCNQPITTSADRATHYMCDEKSIVGKPCICRPDCQDHKDCDPACPPCAIRAGRGIRKPKSN